MARERNIAFDLMKGIGILLMMGCHIASTHSQFVYSFHMPLFFLLSGYCAKTTYPPQRDYSLIKKCTRRLLIPFVVTQLLIVLWGGIQAIAKQDSWFVLQHVYELIWASSDSAPDCMGGVALGPIWFLLALFWAKLIWSYLSQWRLWGVLVATLISFGTYALRRYGGLMQLPFCVVQALIALAFVAIGWMAKNYKIPLWVKIVCIVLWPCSLYWGHVDMSAAVLYPYPLTVLGACGAVYLLYVVCNATTNLLQRLSADIFVKYKTLIQWMGINSLAVMCMHHFEWYSSISYSLFCRIPIEWSTPLVVLARYCIAIGLAWVVTKVPGLKKVYGK